jgi:hypothetical protein
MIAHQAVGTVINIASDLVPMEMLEHQPHVFVEPLVPCSLQQRLCRGFALLVLKAPPSGSAQSNEAGAECMTLTIMAW